MPHDGDLTIYTLYGDLVYAQSIYLIGGFRNADVGTYEALYNQIMSSVRITVEWGFGSIIEQWKFLDLVGSKMQSYFNAQQLTINEYLGLVTDANMD